MIPLSQVLFVANSYSNGVWQPLSEANKEEMATLAVGQADALIGALNHKALEELNNFMIFFKMALKFVMKKWLRENERILKSNSVLEKTERDLYLKIAEIEKRESDSKERIDNAIQDLGCAQANLENLKDSVPVLKLHPFCKVVEVQIQGAIDSLEGN